MTYIEFPVDNTAMDTLLRPFVVYQIKMKETTIFE